MPQVNRITRRNDPDSNNGRIFLHGSYIGFVKDNVDPQCMGRLQVYIPEIGGDPKNPKDWITVSYVTPFGGATSIQGVSKSDQTMAGSQSSYGWWAVPPHLENQVLVTFVNGDTARGYWTGCIFQQNMNQMVPGIAAASTNDPTYKSQGAVPTVEYNKRQDAVNADNPQRPVFTPLTDGMTVQGLRTDPARGPATASARRGGVSNVYGMNSPRGHQLYIDDDTGNEFIRIRTRSGAQILINDTTGFVYINSKSGNAWMELSDAGVEIYSKNSISLRAELDFNLRADRNIILDAGGSLYLRAVTDVNIQAGGQIIGGAGSNLVLSCDSGNASLTVTAGDCLVSVSGNLRSQSGQDTSMKAGGAMVTQSSGNMISSSGAQMTRQASVINDNPGGAPSAPAVQPNVAAVPTPAKAPDIQSGKAATVATIVNVLPTHEPWAGHPSGPQATGASGGAGGSSDTGGAAGAAGAASATTAAANAVGQASSGNVVSTASGAVMVANATAQQLISQYKGQVVGNGQCTSLVKAATGLGPSSTWQQGQTLTADSINNLAPGTPIALFENGRYQNLTNGMSHAALYLGPGTTSDGQPGITVLDQGGGYATNVHTYPFATPGGAGANGQYLRNASNYSVITK